MARPEYSSNVLQVATDDTYANQGDAFDGTVTRVAPAVALLKQAARPSRQIAGQVRNWIDREIAKILSSLIIDATAAVGLADPAVNGTRLSVSSTASVPTADAVGMSQLYLLRHTSSSIALYDATSEQWIRREIAGSSASTPVFSGLVTNSNYDVFALWNGNQVNLELGPAYVDGAAPSLPELGGVFVKGSLAPPTIDPTRRYVGTFRATSATTTEDSATKRFVYNEYNKVRRFLAKTLSADWAYASMTFRQANNSTTSKVEFITRGVCALSARLDVTSFSASATVAYFPSIGIDALTPHANTTRAANGGQPSTADTTSSAVNESVVAPGYHVVNWLEACSTATTVTARFQGSALRATIEV